MAIQVQGNSGIVAEVDGSTFRTLRVTSRPIEYGALGFYRLGMVSGTMAAALAANSEIFQFRWPDATRFAVTYRISFSAGANVAASAAALAAFRLTMARAWTAVGTGGTRATLTGNNQKLRTSMGTSLVNDAGCATTAALGAGTKTLDAHEIGGVAVGIGTGALTVSPSFIIVPHVEILDVNSGTDHPIVQAQNEGWVLRSGNIMPAAMTWHFMVNTSWAEVAAY
jgi:hypothetical protein